MVIWIYIDTLARYEANHGEFRVKRRIEQLSGEPCLALHLSQATPETVRDLSPRALVFSGSSTWFRDVEVSHYHPFEDLLHACPDVPALCVCGSHQLLGFAFNEGIRNLQRIIDEPMRPLRDGEAQVGTLTPDGAGWFREEGFYPVGQVGADPLFAGLPDPFVVRESHVCEIKRLPPCFDLIATSENCRVQAIKHRDRPLWGTQFHPEAYQPEAPHGQHVLLNFLSLAGCGVPVPHQ